MTIKFKRMAANATIPTYSKKGDSGMDVRASECVQILPHSRAVIKTGIAAEIPDGYEIQVRPRSGLAAKSGVVAAFGTVDSGYRGEIGVNLFNHSDDVFIVEIGDRIAQLVVAKVEYVDVVEADELNETERGTAGFGSTGIK